MAGDRAREAFANVEAATNYELALDAAETPADGVGLARGPGSWTLLGDAREQAGLFTEALEAYRRASALRREDPLDTAELMLKRARARRASRLLRPGPAGDDARVPPGREPC